MNANSWPVRRAAMSHGLLLSGAFGHPVGKAVRFLRQSENWTREQLALHQAQALRALLEHCYQFVPYYRELMQHRKLRPEDFRRPRDLAALPYLTREIIREQGDRLRAQNYPDAVCQFRRSGGTTGEPIRVALDKRARGFEVAAYLRGFQWMGYRPGSPMVRLFGGSLGIPNRTTLRTKVREWLFHSRFLPAFELGPGNFHDYVDLIRRSPGGVLVGYASAVLNLAEHMRSAGMQGSPLRSVICTAEYMPKEWRERISGVLGVPVFCYYGCGEITGVAHEHATESGYVVSQEHIIVEAAGKGEAEFQDEGYGKIALTTLYNYAMPLIRYLNGDLVRLGYASSGLAHLRITEMGGRVVDQPICTDGNQISGMFVPHLVYQSGCPAWKYQLVQTSMDRVEFHYVLPSEQQELSPTMQETLQHQLRKHLGSGLHVEFVKGQFLVTPSGKHRIYVDGIPQSRKDRVAPTWRSEVVQ